MEGSKSIAARALVANFLNGGRASLSGIPSCDDSQQMMAVLAAVGRSVSGGKPLEIMAGAGGTTLRFALAAAAVSEGCDILLRATPRLLERPIEPLIAPLREAGADIERLPEGYRVRGRRLKASDISVDASVSSQFLSALYLVAPMFSGGVRITAPQVTSRPYVDMTLKVMRAFGAKFRIIDKDTVEFFGNGYDFAWQYAIEPDWSGASYFFEGALFADIAGLPSAIGRTPQEVEKSLGLVPHGTSLQGDSLCRTLFEKLLAVRPGDYVEMDLSATPDLVPALAVAATLSGRRFRFTGIGNLRVKECDRLTALQTELARLGFTLTADPDYLEYKECKEVSPRKEKEVDPRKKEEVDPRKKEEEVEKTIKIDPQKKVKIHTYDDHRIAMCFHAAKLLYPNIEIENPEVSAKSYPAFYADFHSAFPT